MGIPFINNRLDTLLPSSSKEDNRTGIKVRVGSEFILNRDRKFGRSESVFSGPGAFAFQKLYL